MGNAYNRHSADLFTAFHLAPDFQVQLGLWEIFSPSDVIDYEIIAIIHQAYFLLLQRHVERLPSQKRCGLWLVRFVAFGIN